jgi:hypothetical protein
MQQCVIKDMAVHKLLPYLVTQVLPLYNYPSHRQHVGEHHLHRNHWFI